MGAAEIVVRLFGIAGYGCVSINTQNHALSALLSTGSFWPKMVISQLLAAIDKKPKKSQALFVMGGLAKRKLLKLPLLHHPPFILS